MFGSVCSTVTMIFKQGVSHKGKNRKGMSIFFSYYVFIHIQQIHVFWYQPIAIVVHVCFCDLCDVWCMWWPGTCLMPKPVVIGCHLDSDDCLNENLNEKQKKSFFEEHCSSNFIDSSGKCFVKFTQIMGTFINKIQGISDVFLQSNVFQCFQYKGHATLVAITGTTILVPYLLSQALQLIKLENQALVIFI